MSLKRGRDSFLASLLPPGIRWNSSTSTTPIKRKTEPRQRRPEITKAIRRAVWENSFGRIYESKCITRWCTRHIDVWTFECAHDVPHSKGGSTLVENLIPMCSECNSSMSNLYTLKQWNELGELRNDSKSEDESSSSKRDNKRQKLDESKTSTRTRDESRVYPVLED